MEKQFDLIDFAIHLNREFKDKLIEHKMKFRGNAGSISLISLDKTTPLLGTRKLPLKELKNLNKDNVVAFIDSKKPLVKPARVTPEKELEACILLYNFKVGHSPFDKNIVILTDEFAASNSSNKVVLDLVGFEESTNTFVLIELKSAREASELNRQLNLAEQIVRDDLTFYQSYLKKYGYEWSTPFLIKKIAIWPAVSGHKRENGFNRNLITVYGYKSEGNCYSFSKEEGI